MISFVFAAELKRKIDLWVLLLSAKLYCFITYCRSSRRRCYKTIFECSVTMPVKPSQGWEFQGFAIFLEKVLEI
jgi:hypothetical protein